MSITNDSGVISFSSVSRVLIEDCGFIGHISPTGISFVVCLFDIFKMVLFMLMHH